MTPLAFGLGVAGLLIALLLTGAPVGFALGGVAVGVLAWREGTDGMSAAADSLLAALGDPVLVSVPLFILMGAAASLSPAGADMRELLKRWLHRLPGGLIVANICASALFAALSATGAAVCLAVGREGLDELRERRYPDGVAAGAIAAAGTLGILIPPSLTMIVYGIAGDFSIGRLFLAGLGPGLLLTVLFVSWAVVAARRWRGRFGGFARGYTRGEMFAPLPRVVPFIALVAAVIYGFWNGIASPSEVAGAGAFACLLLVAGIYGMWRGYAMAGIFRESMREGAAVLVIVAGAALFAFMLVRYGVPEALAAFIADLNWNRWQLLAAANVYLFLAGLLLPPIAVILLSAPLLLPLLLAAEFDPYWFGAVLTLNLQLALLTPPVGADLWTVRRLAPDIPVRAVVAGALPFMLLIAAAIVALCIWPEIATWLPDRLMGPPP